MSDERIGVAKAIRELELRQLGNGRRREYTAREPKQNGPNGVRRIRLKRQGASSDSHKTHMHPLQNQVRSIGRRARRWRLVHGFSSAILWILAAASLAGCTDYLLRFQAREARVVVSLAVLAVVVWCCYRFVWPVWTHHPSPLDVARRIESRFPQLQDRLSSTLVFLDQAPNDPTAGSAALRHAVIAQTTEEVGRMDLAACLDPLASRRRAGMALFAVMAVSLLCGSNVGLSLLAVRRLAAPFSREEWPRRHVLQFADAPRRLARGQSFEFRVIDRSRRPPEAVFFQWSYLGPNEEVQTESMRWVDAAFRHRMDAIRRPFKYRAYGGDDDTMDWIDVGLAEPPSIDVYRMILHPPAYTGWPSEEASGESIRVLSGTTIEFGAHVTKRIQSAELRCDAAEGPLNVQTFLHEPGDVFTVAANSERPWRVERSAAYWFEFADRQLLRGGRDPRWQIHAIPDLPPSVAWTDQPTDSVATPGAVLRINATAKDDIALREVSFRFSRSDQAAEGEQVVQLFRGPEIASTEPVTERPGEQQPSAAGQSHTVGYEWDLTRLEGLEPGTRIEIRVTAEDYKPNLGTNSARQITVISRQELEAQITRNQSAILAQLGEALRVQRLVESQVDALRSRLGSAANLDPSDLDRLQSADLAQRQIAQLLGGSPSGAEGQIEALLRLLVTNRVTRSEVVRRMAPIAQIVTQLNREELPLIERELTAAVQERRAQLAGDSEATRQPALPEQESLGAIVEHQRRVIARLEELLGELSQWDSYRRFAGDVGRLQQEQESLRRDSQRLQAETLSKRVHELTDAQRAQLQRLAQRQLELAQRFDRVQGRMQQLESSLRTEDPEAAATLDTALAAATQHAVGQTMRESGRNLEANRIGQALTSQREAVKALDEMFAALSAESDPESEIAAAEFAAANEELAELVARQESVLKQTRAMHERWARQGKWTDDDVARLEELASHQSQLAGDAGALDGLLASEAAFAFVLSRAIEAMRASQVQLQEHSAGSLAQDMQARAIHRLNQLSAALPTEAGPIAPDEQGDASPSADSSSERPNTSPREQLRRLAQLKLARAMQQEIQRRTGELDQSQRQAGALTPQQVAEVESLAEEQEILAKIILELVTGAARK